MIESDFNSIVTKSLNSQGGFGFKIPDERSTLTGFHSKNPYDIFGLFDGHFIAWESKYLQKPSAFNFNNLQEHQIDNLIKAFEICPNAISRFAIGVNFGRADVRCYFWKNEDLYDIKARKDNKKNILKKEFENLDNYIKIKKGQLDIKEILKR